MDQNLGRACPAHDFADDFGGWGTLVATWSPECGLPIPEMSTVTIRIDWKS
jgi:hypothetical protein